MVSEASVLDQRGFRFKYSSGIAPLITGKEYAELIANYKKTGVFPHILNLGGMAIDTSRNRNKWRVPMEDLQAIADQLKGAPLMKDHDIDHVDSIIGKVEEAWVEADKQDPTVGKVMWKGECSDENLIQKILLGYVRHNSIQIAVPAAYCDNCMSNQGKSEEQAGIENLDLPCPRCGSLDMLIRHPMVLEQSMVAIPAYEKADVMPFGFKASLDLRLQKRFEAPKAPAKVAKPSPDLSPMVVTAENAVATAMMGVLEIQVRMANMALDEEAEKQKHLPVGVEHTLERMGGPDVWVPEDLIESEKGEEVKDGDLKDFPLVEKGKSKEEERTDEKAQIQSIVDGALVEYPFDVDLAISEIISELTKLKNALTEPKGEARQDECTCDPNNPEDLCPSCSVLAQSLGMLETSEKPEEAQRRPDTQLKRIADKFGVTVEELSDMATPEELAMLGKE